MTLSHDSKELKSEGECANSSMTNPNERMKEDIMDTDITQRDMTGDLGSDQQKFLLDIHSVIGKTKFTITRMQYAPSCITTKASEDEHHDNWRTAYYEVSGSDVPSIANIISLHVFYKVNTEETVRHRLKSRIVPHLNRDRIQYDVRKYSTTAKFNNIRFMLAMTTFFPMRLGVVHISAVYMQSGPITRQFLVRSPLECNGTKRDLLFKLTKLPYVVSEAGRQWSMVIEDWLLRYMNMKIVTGVSQFFLQRRADGSVSIILSNVTDDLLFAGTTTYI